MPGDLAETVITSVPDPFRRLTDAVVAPFAIRNAYTHRAKNAGSPAGGVFENWGDPVIIDGVPKKGWESIYYETKSGVRIEYSVRDWPQTLIETINAGLRVFTGNPCSS